jgi:hypothetical protein
MSGSGEEKGSATSHVGTGAQGKASGQAAKLEENGQSTLNAAIAKGQHALECALTFLSPF